MSTQVESGTIDQLSVHLSGVKAVNAKYERLGELSVTLDDIKHFRQLASKCAGHPEYRWTAGVETTTGQLGQGVATSVGMAIAHACTQTGRKIRS
jgi:transketolase